MAETIKALRLALQLAYAARPTRASVATGTSYFTTVANLAEGPQSLGAVETAVIDVMQAAADRLAEVAAA
jgi:hypothetical protein